MNFIKYAINLRKKNDLPSVSASAQLFIRVPMYVTVDAIINK